MPLKRPILVAVAALVFLGWFYELSATVATPPVTALLWLDPSTTAFMARDDGAPRQSWVPLGRIAKVLQQAVVLAVDSEFYEHEGVDVEAMKKAAEVDWRRKKFAKGASTIPMQLARNLYLSPRKSLWRKWKELLIALKLERELPKERILEIYLNVAEWGNGIYGAEAAAQHYFGTSAAKLSRHEAAFLAAILPRPRFYDRHRGGPHLNRRIAFIEARI